MKKLIGIVFIGVIVFGVIASWQVFGPTTSAPKGDFFYIKTGSNYDKVKKELLDQNIISGTFLFDKLSEQAKYKQNIKPGKYLIKDGSSLYDLVKMLKRGTQSPVKLVINKLRTKEDFASKITQNFEVDSLEVIKFLNNSDSLAAYKLDSNTVMTAVIPNTYSILWNTGFKKLFTRFHTEQQKFWTTERKQKAAQKNLTQTQVYTIASIVEEETNKATDKPLIASVYNNRLAKGEKLQADPTVKFALKNFELKRILYGHLKYDSPYNTYVYAGLPPGPICTPSTKTIDAVLDAPKTNYMFFVAKPSFDGYSNFAETYAQHQVYAKQYQNALDSLIASRN